jgi:hypothetical protein
MKNVLVIPENELNSGSIINLDKICVIKKLNDDGIAFVFDDDENQEYWLFETKELRNTAYNVLECELLTKKKYDL